MFQDEGIRTVKVREDPNVSIKTIVIGDQQDRIAVSLWRDAANTDLPVGQMVRMTNVVVNHYDNSVSLNSSRDTLVAVSI